MKLTNLTVLLFLLILYSGCRKANEKSSGVLDLLDTDVELMDATTPEPPPPGTKNVIRQADMRIRVKDVKKSVVKLENLAKSMGGFVEYVNIESPERRRSTRLISSDSMLQVMEYTVEGSITMRVPVTFFDSAVNEVQKLAMFLNYRRTSANDISLQYLSNQLKSSANEKSGSRIQDASSAKGKKLDDIVTAEQAASKLAESSIDRKIANFELQQKVNFSSIQVNLHQASEIYKEVIINTDISSYKPSFGERFVYAVKSGWNGLVSLFIFLIQIWPVILFVIVVYILYRGNNLTGWIRKITKQS
jgi:hypothetical protein